MSFDHKCCKKEHIVDQYKKGIEDGLSLFEQTISSEFRDGLLKYEEFRAITQGLEKHRKNTIKFLAHMKRVNF